MADPSLSTHGWAHLACHGQPNVERPFDAAFALRDREVMLLEVVGAAERAPPWLSTVTKRASGPSKNILGAGG
jgi:hypothetical protein